MKIIRLILLIYIAGFMMMAQTIHLGQHVFYNEEGAINVAADAGLAVQKLDSPYVPFILYMGTDKRPATIPRGNVVLIHNDKTYSMPALKDFRAEYKQDTADNRQYASVSMGRESLIMSRMRDYRFAWENDYFPARGSGRMSVDQAGISNVTGFKTFAYFKNPGFQKGDQIVIRVTDRKDANIWGAVALILE